MSDGKLPTMDKRQNTKKPKSCCFKCCCGGCCCRCCRRGSEDSLDKVDGPDDEAHITAINSRQSEGDPTTRKRSEPPSVRCKKCCKNFTAFVFSHLGLCCLVVAYSIMGGFLFQWLESDSEVMERSNVKKVRSAYVQKLWNMTNVFNVLHKGNWSTEADVIMQSFQDSIVTAIKEKGWDGRDADAQEMQWSFAGSLLYSITVITTIGYGHIAPKTDMGRLVTMFYALVGIPLTLLCLANIGSFFGNCFRFLYKHICGGLVWLCCPSHYSQHKPTQYSLDKNSEDAHGIGQPAKGKNGKRASLPNGPKSKQFKAQKTTQKSTPSDEPDSLVALHQKSSFSDLEKGHNPYEELGSDVVYVPIVPAKAKRKKTLKEEVRVPMLVSLMIIALYIFGGAVLFSLWEKDWNYLIGSYFCFITLSTIGFGDYVFGTGVEWNDNEKLIICAFYLIFGLSIIAMGFDLMQEEVRAKFVWLGTKLGIIDNEEEDKEKK